MHRFLDELRAQRREHRWRRKQTLMFIQSDLLIVTHTKSGRTWLRGLLSHLFHLKCGVPADELIRFDNMHARNPAIVLGRTAAFPFTLSEAEG